MESLSTWFQRTAREGNTGSTLTFHNWVKNGDVRAKVNTPWRFQEFRDDKNVEHLLRKFFFQINKNHLTSRAIDGWGFQIMWIPHHENIMQKMNMEIKIECCPHWVLILFYFVPFLFFFYFFCLELFPLHHCNLNLHKLISQCLMSKFILLNKTGFIIVFLRRFLVVQSVMTFGDELNTFCSMALTWVCEGQESYIVI